jgi:putative membrane protein
MNWHYDSMYGFMGGGMWIFWLIMLVVIIVLIRAFINQPKASETAIDILKTRYAKGEITKEEFEEQKKTLLS